MNFFGIKNVAQNSYTKDCKSRVNNFQKEIQKENYEEKSIFNRSTNDIQKQPKESIEYENDEDETMRDYNAYCIAKAIDFFLIDISDFFSALINKTEQNKPEPKQEFGAGSSRGGGASRAF